jgi:hypothetical protein
MPFCHVERTFVPLTPIIASLHLLPYMLCSLAFNVQFVVKYDAAQQRELTRHYDAGDISFMLALSERSSYEGGGTDFDCLNEVLHLEQGDLVVFDASIYHCGVPITTGLRYLLVGFCHTKISAIRAVGNLNLNFDPIYGNRNSVELWHMKRFEEQSQHLLDAVRDLGMRQEAHMLSPSSSWIGCNEDTTCSIASFAKQVFWFHVKRLELEHTMDGGGCEFWTQILDCDPEASDALDSIPWYEMHS